MKKFLFAIAAIAASVGARAEYLYWQIDSSALTQAESEISKNDVTGARIFASTDGGISGTYLDLGYADYDSGYRSIGYAVQVPESVPLVADVTGYTDGSYSFFIELINYNSTYNTTQSAVSSYASGSTDFRGQTQQSDAMTYVQLSECGFAGVDLSPVNMAVWHGGAYSPVPEPTSAVLMLIGMAGLALRRRRAV